MTSRRYNNPTELAIRQRRDMDLAMRRAERHTEPKPDVLVRAEDAADRLLDRASEGGEGR